MAVNVGEKVAGKVTGITNFGAFIDIEGGDTGLIHISEISDSFVKDINDVLSLNEEVTVKVVSVGDDGKIGLSLRQAQDKPKTEQPKFDKGQDAKPHRPYNKPNDNRQGRPNKRSGHGPKSDDFDSLMSSFLKDSDDRLTSLRRNTEGKRGGRGGRRS